MHAVPEVVRRAEQRAAASGFTLSCEAPVGRLLAALAAAVPLGGRVLEIGTGVGVGLAWLLSGLGSRSDVTLTSCEVNSETARLALAEAWPQFVTIHARSFFEVAPELLPVDLLFADSGAGKWQGLDVTLGLVKPGGLLVMDDMTPERWAFPEQESLNREVVRRLRSDPTFAVAELPFSSGVLLAVHRAT
jgi:demethylmenaquinone methyltransferase/2-methoxy-6-polyprenyl-1,4-benzoquinol methylase